MHEAKSNGRAGSRAGGAFEVEGSSRSNHTEHQIQSMLNAIDQLEALVRALETRLAPVVLPPGPTAEPVGNGRSEVHESMCDVAASIRNFDCRVREASGNIEYLISRLDV